MNSPPNSTVGMDPLDLAAMVDAAETESRLWVYASLAHASVATLAVALRLSARSLTIMSWGADDLCISLSLVLLWGLVVDGMIMADQGGMGLLAAMLSPSQSYIFYRTLFASLILYAFAITAAKISVLLLYRRIFPVRSFLIAIYVVGVLCLLWCGVVVLLALLQCQPISYVWDRSIPGRCINLQAMYYGFTISNMALDITICFMPVRLLWKLRLPVRQRVLLIFILLLGIIVIVASIGRIGSVPLLAVTDVSATIFMPLLYTVIEPAFAIIAACLPTYRPLFVWLRSRCSRATHPSSTNAGLHSPVQSISHTTLPSSSGVPQPDPTSSSNSDRSSYAAEKGSAVVVSRVSKASSRTMNYSKPLEKWVEEGSRGWNDQA